MRFNDAYLKKSGTQSKYSGKSPFLADLIWNSNFQTFCYQIYLKDLTIALNNNHIQENRDE